MRRAISPWLALAWFGFAFLPWNALGGGGFFAFQWLEQYPWAPASEPALVQLLWHGRLWFLPLLLALRAPALVVWRPATGTEARRRTAQALVAIGAVGLVYIAAIALAIDIDGWRWRELATVFGELPRRQQGLGYGAVFVAAGVLMLLCHGLALKGWVRGDAFVAGAIGASVALVGLFTLYPLGRLFLHAFLDSAGNLSLTALLARLASSRVWGYDGIVW